jgi:predicted DCC family thiol-disulfide oxidoreductase YuxK
MGSLTLLYDADCNLCLRTVGLLKKLAFRVELRYLPLQDAEPAMLPPGHSRDELLAELHVIDEAGRIFRGADAVVRIMVSARGFGWLRLVERVPGMRPLAHWGYRQIARRRYQLFGRREDCQAEGGSCALHSRSEAKPPEQPRRDG